MSANVNVCFKPVYESITSLMVFIDKRLSKNGEMGPKWVAGIKKQLKPSLLKQLTDKDLAKDLARLLNLMVMAHEQPIDTGRGFLRWVNELNVEELVKQTSFTPATINDFMPHLAKMEKTCDILDKWERHYFHNVDPLIIERLEADAKETLHLSQELPPAELVERVTGGIVLEGTQLTKRIILAPQYHARPFNLTEVKPDLFIAFYPVEQESLPAEPPSQLIRLTSALADESRLKILRFLAQKERTFTDIVKFTGLAKSTVHYHLILLRAAGLSRCHLKTNDILNYSLRRSMLDQVSEKLGEFVDQSELKGRDEFTGKEGE
jgi:DNA-binding transcriptional ArsR family regulator